MRYLALAAVVLAGFAVTEPGLAAPGARGALPAMRGPAFMHRPPAGMFRPVRPYVAPPSPRAFGTVPATKPYGTVKPVAPFGRIPASIAHRVTPGHHHLVRRHHRAYHFGWSFPLSVEGGVSYIGTPYDPAEIIPVYGPAPAAEETATPPAPPRAAAAREENGEACRAERVIVPASEGEREITVVRC